MRAGTLLLLAVVLLAIPILYFDTLRSMLDIWLSSDTYLHGIAIFPISLFLIWNGRRDLSALPLEPNYAGVAVLLGLSLLWWVSAALGAQIGQHVAVVAMFPAAVLAVAGRTLSRRIAFPLAFLLFAVPFGDALIPYLVEFTARFTVRALDVTGIPVVRNGRFFSIPSGEFEVARACSGVRYLLATFAVGNLFAWLSYKSYRKRLIFALFSLLLPIVANGLRAYLIVLIAHLSDMRIAFSIDHIIFGWVFFGVVITVMFLVGGIFRDREYGADESGHKPAAESSPAPGPLNGARLAAMTLFITVSLLVGPALERRDSGNGDAAVLAAQLPASVPGWPLADASQPAWRPALRGATRELYSRYAQAPSTVELAVFMYDRSQQEAELASSANRVAEDLDDWDLSSIQARNVGTFDGRDLVVNEILTSTGAESRLVWYWYQVNGRLINRQLMIKVAELADILGGNPGVSTAVVVSIVVGDDEHVARKALERFVLAAFARIESCAVGASTNRYCVAPLTVSQGGGS